MLVALFIAWLLTLFGVSGAQGLLTWAGQHIVLTIILIIFTL